MDYWLILTVGIFLVTVIDDISAVDKAECYQEDETNTTCKYRCHCSVSKCLGPCRQRCHKQWHGPNCQMRNVALTSTASFSKIVIPTAIPKKAVDGDTTTELYKFGRVMCSVAEAADWYPWWQIQFKGHHPIFRFHIYYRNDNINCGGSQDKCSDVNRNMQVWVGNHSLRSGSGNQTDILHNNQLCYEHDGKTQIHYVEIVTCKSHIAGNTMIILLPYTGVHAPILTLCEVEVFECDDYWFGNPCLWNCQCLDTNEICHKVTGECRGGCKAGYTGLGCLHQCNKSKYGPDCKNDCHCKLPSCNKVTGACQSGCATGWYGDSCEKKCIEGKFGDYCQGDCHCHNGHDKCDRVTGVCSDSVCASGWMGPICQTRCTPGHHGPNCATPCNCQAYDVCDDVTGSCPNTCRLGFTGKDCHEACSHGNYGAGCSGVCRCKNNAMCDKVDGSCEMAGGCMAWYNGTACQYKLPIPPTPFPVIPVAAGVGGLVLLIIIIIVIACVFRRCSRYRMHEKSEFGNEIVVKTNKSFDKEAVEDDVGASSIHTDQVVYHSIVEAEDDVDEGVYVNTGEMLSGETEICVSEIWAEVHRRIDDNSLINEYKALPVGLLEKHNVAQKPGNFEKCRFKGIMPYDKNRVILNINKDIPCSDFINASYINVDLYYAIVVARACVSGYNQPKAYIASQGPLETMREDIWRMIWQVNAGKIIMLTNIIESGKRKCDKYWPDSSSMLCGDFMIEHVDTLTYPGYVVRTLHVRKQGEKESRRILHYHFRNWPDHSVPSETTTLALFREKVHENTNVPQGPMVVHCSSGIGRTGSFIAFDHQMDRARAEGMIDIYHCVHNMRHERLNMVPTSEKYMFLYSVLTDAVLCDGTTISNEDFLRLYPTLVENDGGAKSKIQREYKILQSLKPKASQLCEVASSPENIEKHRTKESFAADDSRVVLVSAVPGTTDYINAVFVPTFLSERSLISTQIPLAETNLDFWRMVYEQKCRCVVMISRSRDEESQSYWPPQGETTKISSFKVTTENYLPSEQFDIRNMRVWYKPSGDANGLAIRNFTFSNWDTRTSLNSDILALILAVRDWCKHSESGPIIVMCSDGTEKCGVFCAALSLVERLMTDHNLNVMTTVKQIRHARRQFINEEQYRLLYDIMRTYFNENREESEILY